MPITPDTKDWTWVLDRPCDECGFDSSTVAVADIGRLVRDNASTWRRVLARPDVAIRPSDDRWSPLEYACHVRDVFRLYDERLSLMLAEDDPTFANWDQDVTAVEQRYDEQDPATVADELDCGRRRFRRPPRRTRRRRHGAAPARVATAPRSLSTRSPGT